MNQEHSYGILPLRLVAKEWQIFLVQHLAGHWSFPKGRPNCDENPKETAQRELFEETGLQVLRFLPFEELKEEYTFQREGKTVQKQVTYFIAEVAGKEKLQAEEISQGKWFSLSNALNRITFEEGRKVCLELQNLLI